MSVVVCVFFVVLSLLLQYCGK